MKRCTKCGEEKPKTEFCKQKDRIDGLQSHCKACRKVARTENSEHLKAVSAAYYANNREKFRESSAAYRSANRDKLKSYGAAYYAANREKCGAAQAEYRLVNREKCKATYAAWYEKNAERWRASVAAYRAANPEKCKAKCTEWKKANPEAIRIHSQNRRARKREAGGELSQGLSAKLFKLQRGKCACGCKQPLGADYHLDHRMPLALGGSNTDDNMQLLRAICNYHKYTKHPIDFMQSKGFLL